MRTDTATRLIPVSPETLYGAFVDPEALIAWLISKIVSSWRRTSSSRL